MYQTYQNTITLPAEILYNELSLLSYGNYKQWCSRGKINKVRNGGNGRVALIEFASLPELFKAAVKDVYGDPYKADAMQRFIDQLQSNPDAHDYYSTQGLLPEKINQYYCEAKILDLYHVLVQRIKVKQHNGIKIKMGDAKKEICQVIQELKNITHPHTKAKQYPHRLPANYRALDFKFHTYKTEGLSALIHKNEGNTNSKKIKGAVADWILAYYQLPNKPVVPVLYMEYMRHRATKSFPVLSESAIAKWLGEPAQEKRWYLARHGKQEWRNKYGHKLSRDRSNWFPNAYWAIDGSKLDWAHFKDNSLGMGADIKIDVVFDVYSEKIMGYSFSETETHQDHFKALKMAVNDSLKQPYLFTYDGQSGHTTSIMQELYTNLVADGKGEHYKHAARQHGSPVEGLFSRFQQQILNTKWFSDKQGIKTRKMDSSANMDFLMENRHNLPKMENLEKVFIQCVEQWNTAQHPKFDETRASVYQYHEELFQSPISIFQAMDMFWVFTKDPVNYGTSGILPIISKKQYHYEVYDADGGVDMDFRDKHTHSKFYVQYDPDQMDNYVRLYLNLPNGKRKFIKDAQPKRTVETIPALMTPQSKAQMWKDRQVRKTELARIEKENKDLQHRTGVTPETLIQEQELLIKMGGRLPKKVRSQLESNSILNRI